MYSIPVTRSKEGLPLLSESGGDWVGPDSVVVVGGPHGELLRPMHPVQDQNAVFILHTGMLVVRAKREFRETIVEMYRVMEIPPAGATPDEAILQPVSTVQLKDSGLPAELDGLVTAAAAKAAHAYRSSREQLRA